MSSYCSECEESFPITKFSICSICGSTLSNRIEDSNRTITVERSNSVNYNLADILGENFMELLSNSLPTSNISIDYLDRLSKIPIDSNKTILLECYLAIQNLNFLSVPASFCRNYKETKIDGFMSLCDPIYGEGPFDNRYNEKILFMKRGSISFKEKAIKAELAGAKALVIMQDTDKWPFIMTESTSIDYNVNIPVVMISQTNSEIVVNLLRKSKESLNCSLIFNGFEKECSICQDEYKIDEIVTKLECRHVYHFDCLRGWLSSHDTCPMCRNHLPSVDVRTSKINRQSITDVSLLNGTII